MIRILIISLVILGTPVLASEAPSGSGSVDHLEYWFATELGLLDAEAVYGTSKHRAVLTILGVSTRDDRYVDVALLYRVALTDNFDLQAGIEFTDEDNSLVLGFQAQLPHFIELEVQTTFDKHGNGYASAKLEQDWPIGERLHFLPKLEIFGAMQNDPESDARAGFTSVFAELRLGYRLGTSFVPYVGVVWEHTVGEVEGTVEVSHVERSEISALVGVSFTF